jgi:heptosyltransferase-2
MNGQERLPRTLVVHQYVGIGDLIWHLPYIRAVAATSFAGKVSVLARPSTRAREILSAESCMDAVFDHDRRPRRSEGRKGRHDGIAGMYRMAAELKPYSFDRAIIFSGRWHFALLARLAGIPVRLGFGYALPQRLFLTGGPYIKRYRGDAVHVFREASAFAVAHGFCPRPIAPKMRVPESSIAAAADLLAGLRRPIVAFAIGTSEARKHWGDERYGALAAELCSRGMSVVCLGGPADQQSAERIRAAVPAELQAAVCLVMQPSVLLSAGVLRHCSLVIGNDTGVVQMGPANEVQTVCILGNRPVLDQDPLMHCIRAERLIDIGVADVLQQSKLGPAKLDASPCAHDGMRRAEQPADPASK